MNIIIFDDTPRCPRCHAPRINNRWYDDEDYHCWCCGYVEYGKLSEERTHFRDHVGYRKVNKGEANGKSL